MIKIAIIEDEKEIRDFLLSLVQKQEMDVNVIAFASAEEFLQKNEGFDLLFVDIELRKLSSAENTLLFHQSDQENTLSFADYPSNKDFILEETDNLFSQKEDINVFKKNQLCKSEIWNFMTGMELAKHIRTHSTYQPIIVFVTGYEEYVFDAFDVDAFHYLLKPINEEKLKQVLYKAVEKIKKKKEPVIELCFAGVSRKLVASEIYYIESFNHKICVHTKTQSMEYYARIGELEELLKDTFFRIHKGYLINLAYVDSYTRTEVNLKNGATLFLSKYKYHDFVKAYLKYLEREI